MTAKDREAARFRFCAEVARGLAEPTTPDEGQLVLLAAALLRDDDAARLQQAGERYFSAIGREPLSLQEFLRQGPVRDLPRFHDGVEEALSALPRAP